MKFQINLLSEKNDSTIDRVIYFSLNYLRYILVITQIVVIFVFFYKFKVDQEIIDLKEAVDQKKEIIEISRPLLKEAEAAEFKINKIKPLLKEQSGLLNQFNYLLSNFPQSLFLTKYRVNGNQTTLEGYTQDARVIRQFYAWLQKNKKFKEINLNSLKKTDYGYEFVFVFNDFIN